MLSIMALVAAAIGYFLFFFTEAIEFPMLLIIISFVVALIDLVTLYNKGKIPFNEFAKKAFKERIGSSISVVAGIFLIFLIIF